ncbi:sigma-70 family RNA polymerase sigma factor [Pseudoalteromonas sp. LC2018020214]|nr:sigma-70 family RNA polymerase sigma factor [Pseudoalteromonas sp. LC2018020214]
MSRRTNNTDDVDDLVQEALLRTLNRNDASEIENFQAYINQVAKSVMYSDWQKNKNQPNNAEDIELFTNDNSDPEAQSITEQKLELVKSALQELPPLRRKVFKLRRIDGLSREEISLQLNMSQESVKKHITRAMIQITLSIEKNQ